MNAYRKIIMMMRIQLTGDAPEFTILWEGTREMPMKSLGGFLCELELCDGNEEMMHEEHKSLVTEKAEI